MDSEQKPRRKRRSLAEMTIDELVAPMFELWESDDPKEAADGARLLLYQKRLLEKHGPGGKEADDDEDEDAKRDRQDAVARAKRAMKAMESEG